MLVGLGTGSTAAHAVRLLGERVRAGLAVRAVATSHATERLAAECGIPVIDFADGISDALTFTEAEYRRLRRGWRLP